MTSRLLLPITTCLLVTTLGLAPAAAEDFPVPESAPAKGADEWSAPSGPSSAKPAPAASNLPPPRIVKRRSGNAAATPAATPSTGTFQADPMPARRTTTNAAPLPSQPATVTRVPARPAPPTMMTGTSRTPAGTAARPATPRVTAVNGRVISIEKTHNVESEAIETGGPLFLQLDIEYEVMNQQGRDVYVGVWFARKDNGQLIKSLTHDYRDGGGNLTIQTRWTRVIGPRVKYAATLLIPYYTFPADQTEESYEVEVRVNVLRNERQRGRVSVLARDMTTFRVFGTPKDELPDAPTGPVIDRRAYAMPGGEGKILEPGIPTGRGATHVPGETGTILTPGIQDGSGPKATPGETGIIRDK